MQELLFSITYPPIPITQVGPISLSLHGVFAAIGFYFGANHALKLSEEDGADSELFSEALTWAIFGAIQVLDFLQFQLNGTLTQITDLMTSLLLQEAIQLWAGWLVE